MNEKNKVMATKTLTISLVTKSFDVINWTFAEIKKKMFIKVRKQITSLRKHHPRADIKRL